MILRTEFENCKPHFNVKEHTIQPVTFFRVSSGLHLSLWGPLSKTDWPPLI